MTKKHAYIPLLFLLLILLMTVNCKKPPKFSTDDIETGSLVLPEGQAFEVVEYSTVAVEKSLARDGLLQGFIDDNGDGIPDGARWGELEVKGDIGPSNARGHVYGDRRYVAFYPAEMTAIPNPGEVKLLGFIHYFDDYYYDVTLAAVIRQKEDDAGKSGTQVAFINSKGDQTGNPAYAFYPRKDVESLVSYKRWADSGLDYALAADPEQDAFFILMKDLGFPDEIIIIAFRWY